MAWRRAANMDRLRSNVLAKFPGMTIYDIGDTAHATGRSGHNPDDMVLPEGGTAELTDADTLQEVRALDFMIGPKFTSTNAAELVRALRDPRSRSRLYYVIYNRRIYRRDGSDSPYSGDNPHTTHVHASGWNGDDANTADWPAVLEIGNAMATLDDEDLANIASAVWHKRIESDGLNRSAVASEWQKDALGNRQNYLVPILANVIALNGKDFVDEHAIATAVLNGIGTKSVEDIADALRSTIDPEKLAALKAIL